MVAVAAAYGAGMMQGDCARDRHQVREDVINALWHLLKAKPVILRVCACIASSVLMVLC
jgi:hypothetical protein